MASNSSGVSGLAERYAAALFDLADEQKALDEVAGDLKRLREMLRESADLRRLVRSPVLSREEQGRAIGALAHVLLRWLGSAVGLPGAGLLSGVVSSTATIAA